jgi:hypothetical protein
MIPVDFDGGEHVYRVNPINVQLVTDPVIIPAMEDHGCDSGSESLDKDKPRDIFHQNPPETLQELGDTPVHEWKNIPHACIHRSIGSMLQRGEAVVAARGDHTRY